MSKRVLGLDYDDVLMLQTESLHEYYNSRFGTSCTIDTHVTYSLPDVWGCTKEQAQEVVFDFYHSQEHMDTPALPGSVEALSELKDIYSIVVITSRPEMAREPSIGWLHKNFGDIFDHVCLTNLYGGQGVVRSKSEVCDELGVSVFVDDHIKYAEDVVGDDRRVLLVDRPWNQVDITHPNITRVKGWDEILEILKYSHVPAVSAKIQS